MPHCVVSTRTTVPKPRWVRSGVNARSTAHTHTFGDSPTKKL